MFHYLNQHQLNILSKNKYFQVFVYQFIDMKMLNMKYSNKVFLFT